MTPEQSAQLMIRARRSYLRTATDVARDDPAWLHRLIAACEAGQHAYMRPIHIRICKLALRRAGAGYQKETNQ